MKDLVCPACNHILLAKILETEARGKIGIDHCPYCGGAWFDHFEVNRLSEKEVNLLTKISSTSEVKSSQAGTSEMSSSDTKRGQCPRCKIPLERLVAESIPHDTKVFFCPKCKGNFFSPKNLKRFKEAQKAKLSYFKTWKIPLPSVYAVLIPLLIVAFLSISIPFTVKRVQEGYQTQLRAKEVIIAPTVIKLNPESVIIAFGTSVPATSSVEYQTDRLKIKKQVSSKFATNHTIELSNLKPQTTYSYQIFVETKEGEKLASEKLSFTTD